MTTEAATTDGRANYGTTCCPVCDRPTRLTGAGALYTHPASAGWPRRIDWTRNCVASRRTVAEVTADTALQPSDPDQQEPVTLADAVNGRLDELDLTVADLADQTGIGVDTLERVVSGLTRRPHDRTAAALEEAFGWPPGRVLDLAPRTQGGRRRAIIIRHHQPRTVLTLPDPADRHRRAAEAAEQRRQVDRWTYALEVARIITEEASR